MAPGDDDRREKDVDDDDSSDDAIDAGETGAEARSEQRNR
jgi:hypothetical protein